MMAIRVSGQLGQHGGAEGPKVLPDLPGHQDHRHCWSRALPRTRSESRIVSYQNVGFNNVAVQPKINVRGYLSAAYLFR